MLVWPVVLVLLVYVLRVFLKHVPNRRATESASFSFTVGENCAHQGAYYKLTSLSYFGRSD